MDDARLATLLDEAADRYNSGRYDEAIALWQQVLASDPQNQKAKEGIRMAGLLVQDWHEGDAPATEPADDRDQDPAGLRGRVEAGISRVRDLAAGGRLDDALEGCRLLEEIAPHLPEVGRLGAEVRATARARPGARGTPPDARREPNASTPSADDVEGLLDRARRALAAGRDAEAAVAARDAIQLDPSNNEAMGILALTGQTGEVTAPPRAAPAAVPDPHATGPLPAAAAPEPVSSLDIEMIDVEPSASATATRPGTAPGPPAADETSGTRLLTPASHSRIEGLLAEGQAAFDHGEPQRAIEIWSRIFAIDQTNAEAGGRIDRAKQALEEQARQVDELFYVAVDAQEAGRPEEARRTLERILSMAPEHAEARAFMERLDEKASSPAAAIPLDGRAATEPEKKPRLHSEKRQLFDGGSVPLAVPRAEIARSATRSQRPPAAPRPLAPAHPAAGGGWLRRLATAAAGIVVLGGAGLGAYVWFGTSGGSLPEARATVAASVRPPAPAVAPPPVAPQVLQGPLTVVPGGASAPPEKPPEPPAPVPSRAPLDAPSLEREGRGHFQARRWAEAVLTLRQALQADPLGFQSQDLLDQAMLELQNQARLESEMGAVGKACVDGDYGTALHKLYRLQQDFPDMNVLDDYIKNAWFNWGILLLRDGAPEEAAEKFAEALDLDRGDHEATRAREIALRYRKRPADETLRAFAAALPLRPLDQP